MKRFFQTIKNIFSIEDLRVRGSSIPCGFLIIFRLGSYILSCLGIDANRIIGSASVTSDPVYSGSSTHFLGGSFNNASIFAFGIMPYISASIIVQLLTFAVPYFQKLQKEGESGRKRIKSVYPRTDDRHHDFPGIQLPERRN